MATDLYLVITDGSTTVTIADGLGGATNYKLHYGGWAPTIAGRRRSSLGGRGPYEDAIEEMVLDIYGATAAAAYANLRTLISLLDQADRWSNNETNFSAVLLKYSPGGGTVSSTANPLQAPILGRADGDNTIGARLSPEFNAAQNMYAILGVKVRIKRPGLWLHISETQASAGTDNGDVATVSGLTGQGVLSPTKVNITAFGFNGTSSYTFSDGYVLLARAAADIQIINGKDLSGTSGFTSVNDSANFAHGTNVLRYTPADTAEHLAAAKSLSPSSYSRRICILFNARNNHATTTFNVRAKVSNSYDYFYTPSVVVPVSSGPDWIFLGFVSLPNEPTKINLAITASAAAGTLDIDGIIVLDLSSPQNHILQVYQSNSPDGVGSFGDFTIDHRALTDPQPAVLKGTSGLPYSGDPFLATRAATLYALLLQNGEDGSTITWREVYGPGFVQQNTFTITRTAAYLTPV